MPLKLVFENPERIKLYEPNLKNKFYILQLLVYLFIFGSVLYFFTIFHPSYQLYCEGKTASAATGCRLKATYFFIIPWNTPLGDLESASFQINPDYTRNKLSNSCGEIALLARTLPKPMSYEIEKPKKISFYISCGNFDELKAIAAEINSFLKEQKTKEFNIPSLPLTLGPYLFVIGFLALLFYQSKRIETSFDKNLELVTVKTTWIISQIKTYPLKDVKSIGFFYQALNKQCHLVLSLGFNWIDLGNISDLEVTEQKRLCRTIKDFLGLKG